MRRELDNFQELSGVSTTVLTAVVKQPLSLALYLLTPIVFRSAGRFSIGAWFHSCRHLG